LIVCIAVFASVVWPYYGVVMFVVVIHLSLALQLAFCPFEFAQMQRVQLAALGSLDITGCVTLTFFKVDRHAHTKAFTAYKEVAGSLLLMMHVCFLCWCMLIVLSGLSVQRVRALASALLARAPCACSRPTCSSYRPQHAHPLDESVLPANTADAVRSQANAQLQHSKLQHSKYGGSPARASAAAGACKGSSSSATATPESGSSMSANAVVVSLPQCYGQRKDMEAALDGS
jgi:glucan phosphoethanolaminetransferase (alkaline phosphatase superfamily)